MVQVKEKAQKGVCGSQSGKRGNKDNKEVDGELVRGREVGELQEHEGRATIR